VGEAQDEYFKKSDIIATNATRDARDPSKRSTSEIKRGLQSSLDDAVELFKLCGEAYSEALNEAGEAGGLWGKSRRVGKVRAEWQPRVENASLQIKFISSAMRIIDKRSKSMDVDRGND
jgi:hypothetical protein